MPPAFSRRRTARFIYLFLFLLLIFSAFAYRNLVSLTPLISINYAAEQVAQPHVLALDHPTFADVRQYEHTLPQHTLPLFTKPVRARCVFPRVMGA